MVVAAQNQRGVIGAAKTLMWLQSHGFGALLHRTVVALNATDRGRALVDVDKAEAFLRGDGSIPIEVVRIPYDAHLAEGGAVEYDALESSTRKALLELAATVADHYPLRYASTDQVM